MALLPSRIKSGTYTFVIPTLTVNYSNPYNIVISGIGTGVRVFYTTDGSTPTIGGSGSTEYTTPFGIVGAVTLNVKAFKDGWVGVTQSYGVSVCSLCDEESPTISYTSQQMTTSTQQNLSVADYGVLDSTCFTWEITDGTGELSTTSGISTVYTAPATNADCDNNPTIVLYCNEVEVDTLDIAVIAGNVPAEWYVYTITSPCSTTAPIGGGSWCAIPGMDYGCYAMSYNCYDTPNCTPTTCPHWVCCADDDPTCADAHPDCIRQFVDGSFWAACGQTYDRRTEFQKGYGCCPAGLL